MTHSLKFQSILIVTYGRTGSTLLQGLLNSIKGCLIRGENNQSCYNLFEAYKNIINIKRHHGILVTNPFYGAHLLDEQVFLEYSSKMVKQLLIAEKKMKQKLYVMEPKKSATLIYSTTFLNILTSSP